MLRRSPAELREALPGTGPGATAIAELIAEVPDDDLRAAVRNLGGHDLAALRAAFADIDDTRPTVVLAYTLKGYGLATEGHPQNHSALLNEAQIGQLAQDLGVDRPGRWAPAPPHSPPAGLSPAAAAGLRRAEQQSGAPRAV